MSAPDVTPEAAVSTTGQKRAHSPEENFDGAHKNNKRTKRVESPTSVSTASKPISMNASAECGTNGTGAAAEVVTASAGAGVSDNSKRPKPLTGTFDLYGMNFLFLNSAYSPKGSSPVDPENLYKNILKYQAKSDRTAKLTIPDNFVSTNEGCLDCGIFIDPGVEFPFEIAATHIKEVAKSNFKSKYARPAATQGVWNGVGIKASLKIAGGRRCGITSSSGSISLRPMWRKVDKDGNTLELFEGTLTFKVKYGSMYSRKGLGSGLNETIDFWAVRGSR